MMYERDKVRHPGKTKKDKATGAWGNRFSNRAQRNDWCQHPKKNSFPLHTCNGKKSQAIRGSKKTVKIRKSRSRQVIN